MNRKVSQISSLLISIGIVIGFGIFFKASDIFSYVSIVVILIILISLINIKDNKELVLSDS